MGHAWREMLDARDERFGTTAEHFGVDLDRIASTGPTVELAEALGRCLTCGRQAECNSWQALPVAERSSGPDFCPNIAFFGLYAKRNAAAPKQRPRGRVVRFLDYVDDLLTCVRFVEWGRRPPDGVEGIGIEPTSFRWGLPGDRDGAHGQRLQ